MPILQRSRSPEQCFESSGEIPALLKGSEEAEARATCSSLLNDTNNLFVKALL